ncbi:restriction endonuclease subunit S [Paenibacillus sp. BR2-3]|uniref:restriction endonuclease subunit S n=1 Tax=Paenibacillus sp. BR2-3 TaxID=3048494 RepID=UPI003977396E
MSFNEWREVKLGEVSKVLSGYAFKSKDFCESGIPVVKIKNIVPPNVQINDVQFVSTELAKEKSKYLLGYNDVLISMTGSNVNQFSSAVGKVGRVRIHKPMLINQRVGKFEIIDLDSYNLDFLYYLISTDEMHYKLALNASGAANQANISPSIIEDIVLPCPPIEEQKAIAATLSCFDDKIELINRMNKNLEDMAQAIFKSWFVDFELFQDGEFENSEVGMIPKGWRVGRLEEVLSEIEAGNRPKGGAGNLEYGIPSIGAENILGLGKYDFSKEKFVPEGYFKSMNRGIVKNWDVLLYKDGAQLGRKTMFARNFPHEKCCINSHVFILRSNELVNQPYLYFWLDQDYMTQNIVNLNTNSAQPGINQPAVKTLKILIPDKNTVDRFQHIIEKILVLIFENCKESRKLTILRDTLLPKLMSGEIQVPLEEVQ